MGHACSNLVPIPEACVLEVILTVLLRVSMTSLLACSLLSGIGTNDALARTLGNTATGKAKNLHPGKLATKTTPPMDGVAPVSAPEVIHVSSSHATGQREQPGGGLLRVETAPKAIQTVSRDFISKQSPTTNVEQVLKMMPSANVNDQDPFGLQSGSMSVRGLNQTEIGWTLDGMPMNDIGGGAFYANEVLEAEDLESVSLQPGSVNLDSPVISAAGGLVSATMSNPTHKRGGLFDATFGSFGMKREFIRYNSGDIGNTGVRAMFSFGHTYADHWRGPGHDEKFHYDLKVRKDFSNGSNTGITISYNDQINDSYLNPNYTQYNTTGYDTNYLSNYTGVNSQGAQYYKLHANPFRNIIASAPTHIEVTPRFSIDDTAYFWFGQGNGTGASVLNANQTYYGDQKLSGVLPSDGSTLVLTPSNQEQIRSGNTLKFNYRLGSHHHITAGYWYEYANLEQFSPVGMVNQATGQPSNIWGTSGVYKMPNGQNYDYRNFLNLSQVNMLFVGDSMDYFNKRLHIDVGFKEAMVTRRVYNDIPGTTYNRNLHSAEPLPQLGISWQFNKQHQIYIMGATNFKMPSNTSLVDQRNNTTGAISQMGGASNPEYSISEEIGYRYNGPLIIGSISFFNYNFTNRQLTVDYYLNGASYSQSVNAGGQTSRGVDIQIGTRPLKYHLRPYASFEYLDARIDNNLRAVGTYANGVQGTDYLATKGKTQVESPKVQAALGLDYDDGHFFAGAQIKYVGKQYSTMMNDNSIPQFITDNINFGYRFRTIGFMQTPKIQVNLSNLTNARFRSGVYTMQTNANATTGVNGSTIKGSSPAYYLQAPFTGVVTISTNF
ncbi:TonB-dependent receptor [Komagataeibacter medellinensis]|uniref:TonB-dependent receptor n=2 Tax=Komagataeibacter medellinensis TaxID=1177712 RepID=A0ABQ6VX57_9PROT|nr:TonB-dependent receptor [Komagataeibacter medellinensis]